jgi:hypothetical protein
MFELTDSTNYTFGKLKLFFSLFAKLGNKDGSSGIKQFFVKLFRMRSLMAGSLYYD